MCLVIRGFRFPKVIHVATDTLGRQALTIKGPDRAYLVAGITVNRRMRPDEREAVLMLIDVVDRHLPSGVAVAQITLGSIFSPMDIRVAVLTLISDFGEHQVGMTILTTNALVHPTQSEASLAMIELKNATKRFPTLRSMAILAGCLQYTVRTLVRARLRPRLRPRRQANLEK